VVQPIGHVAAAAAVFAGTNVDDIIVLTVLFLSSHATGKPRPRQIWIGQYAGMAALVAVSASAALGFAFVPAPWVGLLGLVPIGLGVRGLFRALRRRSTEASIPVATGAGSVFAVTLANGSDNISVYAPMFRMSNATANSITVAVFAVLVSVWCLAGSWLGSHPRVIAVIERFGHFIVPLVFIVIGTVIVLEGGIIERLAGA